MRLLGYSGLKDKKGTHMIELKIEQESTSAILLKIVVSGWVPQLAAELNEIEFPQLDVRKGLIISGFPQFVAATVAMHYKDLNQWVGMVDPKLDAQPSCVVVHSTNREYRIGDILPLSISVSLSAA